MSLTTPRLETDDDIHFGVAARALGAPATVSKRSLLAALEQRRRDDSHLTQAAEIEQGGSGTGWFSRDSAPGPEISAARGPSWSRCSTSSWPYKLRAPTPRSPPARGLSTIADAERDGEQRADKSSAATCCGSNARRPPRREADSEYEHATSRAGRLGLLPPRDRRRGGPPVPRAARLSLECARRRWPAGRLS